MASNVGEYIAFHHGTDFHVTSGFVAAERIAEGAEEVEQIGDKSHLACRFRRQKTRSLSILWHLPV
jgi:hypothetical protein